MTTNENVDFLRRGYEALARTDIDSFTELARERLGPEFEFHPVWDGRVFRGFQGTQEWLADTRDTWADYDQQVEEITDLGEHVLVVLRISGRGTGSGVPVAQEIVVLWTFEGDRAVRAESFTSKAEALEAAARV